MSYQFVHKGSPYKKFLHQNFFLPATMHQNERQRPH